MKPPSRASKALTPEGEVEPTLDDQSRACLSLAASVLRVAVFDYIRGPGSEARHEWFESAAEFFASEDIDQPYGFPWICQVLFAEPERRRQEILKHIAEQRALRSLHREQN